MGHQSKKSVFLCIQLRACGDVLKGEQNEMVTILLPYEPMRIEQHHLVTNRGKGCLHLNVLEGVVGWENLFQERAQRGKVPLPVA